MTLRILTALLLGAAAIAQAAFAASTPPITGRSVVTSRFGIVATSQPMASMTGVQILQRGGNAVDAAIAANGVLGVMEPVANGIGGDLFALIYEAKTGHVYALNASGWSPRALTPEFLAARGITAMPKYGIHAVTVPGIVGGWVVMRDRFGRLPFSTLLAPAIHYAENGVPINEVTATLWQLHVSRLALDRSSATTFLIDGRAPRSGEIFRNPDLGASLRLIAQHGRDGFYGGPTAEAIVATSRKLGGAMTLDDLAQFQPEWVKSISTTYRGWTVYETPPNTQGIAALMMLDLMEQFPLTEYGFHSPQALHVMIEAKKLAYADMLRYVADPRLASIPVPQMLDKGRAAERAKLIGERANCAVKVSEFKELTASNADDTIYMTAIDREGNIVSVIASNASGFGSGIVPSATGFMLHNRGQAFTLESGHPNTLAGRKRPLHTIIPALMQKGDVRIGFGIMGGWNQAQAHAQFVSNIADHGMNLQQALEAGRFSKRTWEGCDVPIEDLVPEPTRARLSALGHELEVISERSFDFGFGQAVMSDGSGTHYGASDPRHDGAAIPEPAPVFEALSKPRQVPDQNR